MIQQIPTGRPAQAMAAMCCYLLLLLLLPPQIGSHCRPAAGSGKAHAGNEPVKQSPVQAQAGATEVAPLVVLK
jgi:hypothetical protein